MRPDKELPGWHSASLALGVQHVGVHRPATPARRACRAPSPGAAWAAILAVPTAIAGIYGMNFEHMPELKSRFGYPVVLGVIAAICAILYARFKKLKWL